MSEQSVNRDDLDSVTEFIAGMPPELNAPKALLSQLVTDLKDAMDDMTVAPVSVVAAEDDVEDDTVEPIGKQFADAFVPAASGHAVEIRLHKVHRA
jgi:hypothetical protein